jgi:hypothetical protein
MSQGERARFYEGQYLSADDLSTLEDYPRVQQAQHALGAHTWGIAIGLDLVEKTLPSGEIQNVVMPGFAWDGYGRVIVVLAPAKISPQKFVNFQGTTPPEGQLVKVWIRHDENETANPQPGFEACGVDDQHARVAESFALEVGDPMAGPNDTVQIGGAPVDPLNARSVFDAAAPPLYDESVPFQEFPTTAKPRWLLPLGYVRWQKLAGQPGQFVARDDSGASGAVKDSDLIRAFRRYIGLVVETVDAAAGVIRLRHRGKDPDPDKTFFHPPNVTSDPANPNDLVWIEGSLRVQGHTRLASGRLEWRTDEGLDGDTPTWIRRRGDAGKAKGETGGRALEVAIGQSGQDDSRLVVGPLDAKDKIDEVLTVLSGGHVGVDQSQPKTSLHLQTKTVLEEGKKNGATWSNLGCNSYFDGSWNRVSSTDPGVSLHMSPAGGGSEFRFLRVEANGSNQRNIAAIGTSASFIREGLVGIGNDAPKAQIHVKTLTAIDEGSSAEGTWANFGQNSYFDGSWNQIDSGKAGANLHINPDGNGMEFRFLRSEKGNVNVRNIGVIGSETSFVAEGRFGVGTTNPAARLDVDGRILRKSQDFSRTGSANHFDLVAPPWGTTDDWNIFVAPRFMGREEPGSEADNALLVVDCHADADPSKTGFRVTALYKYKYSNSIPDGTWYQDGTVNYILVPR